MIQASLYFYHPEKPLHGGIACAISGSGEVERNFGVLSSVVLPRLQAMILEVVRLSTTRNGGLNNKWPFSGAMCTSRRKTVITTGDISGFYLRLVAQDEL